MLMKVNGMYINLDVCPAFRVTACDGGVRLAVSDYNWTEVKDVADWEVHAAIAYKLEKDPKNFDLVNTINFLRRVHGDD